MLRSCDWDLFCIFDVVRVYLPMRKTSPSLDEEE